VGTFKSTVSLADGREQVCGFHLPGEFISVDGGWDGLHPTTVTALEDSQTCAIPYAALLKVAAGMPTLQQLLYRSMGRELSRARRHMLVLGNMNAGERVAAFLLDMSQRSLARGYSKNEFVLRMSRAEIGSYLGLSLETVSRVLSGFKRARHLDVDNRVIRINDLEGFTRAFESTVA
jgi:CRP/FNR family transcriptional regulator